MGVTYIAKAFLTLLILLGLFLMSILEVEVPLVIDLPTSGSD